MSKENVPVENVADEEQIKAAKKKERRKDQQEIEDVKEILRTKPGRRFFWRYMAKCNVFSSVRGPSPNIYFQEGFRQVGLDIMSDIINANPNALIEMMVAAMQEGENNT